MRSADTSGDSFVFSVSLNSVADILKTARVSPQKHKILNNRNGVTQHL